jgi:hypothetical protein
VVATDMLVKVTIPSTSGQASDAAVNSFAFHSGDPAVAFTALGLFYGNANTHQPIGSYLAGYMDHTASAVLMQAYDLSAHLDGSPHGSPIATAHITLPAVAQSANLPEQVAAVLAYHADFGTQVEHGPMHTEPTSEAAQDAGAPTTASVKSRPRSGLRGRIYLGPLCVPSIDQATGAMSATIADDLAVAAKRLRDHPAAGWGVWTRRGAAVHPVVAGWIDANMGVVRRRKLKAATHIQWV